MRADGFEQLAGLWSFVIDVDSELFSFGPNGGEQLCCIWSIGGVDLQHALDGCCQLFGVVIAYFGIGTFYHFFVESVHVFGAERRLECGHFVNDAPQ